MFHFFSRPLVKLAIWLDYEGFITDPVSIETGEATLKLAKNSPVLARSKDLEECGARLS